MTVERWTDSLCHTLNNSRSNIARGGFKCSCQARAMSIVQFPAHSKFIANVFCHRGHLPAQQWAGLLCRVGDADLRRCKDPQEARSLDVKVRRQPDS